tara:strand:+ start:239 stop:460 length:222 start_codon:yes stop_codon:yes gene_type:complete
MPTYPIINKKTGEKQELSMTISQYTQWCKDNPDWHKDWSAQDEIVIRYGDTFFSGTKKPDGHNRNKDSCPFHF